MMSDIYYGKIKPDKLAIWETNKDPYEILEERTLIQNLSGWKFLQIAESIFHNGRQVDWGSFAYKCTKQQLLELRDKTHCDIENLEGLCDTETYGVVFIEQP